MNSAAASNNALGINVVKVPPLKFQDVPSFIKTQAALELHLVQTFGWEYNFLSKGAYEDTPMPQPTDYSQLPISAAEKTNLLSRAIDRHFGEEFVRKTNRGKICGFMLQLLSPEGYQAVVSDADFVGLRSLTDPLAIWKLVLKTHVTEKLGGSAGNRAFQRNAAQRKLMSLRMVKGQTLLEYLGVFNILTDTFVALGGTKAPEEDRAVDFITGASSFYGKYITAMQNGTLIGGAAVVTPATVETAFTALRLFGSDDDSSGDARHGSSQRVQMHADTGVSAGGASRSNKKKTGNCRRCGKAGHWAADCRAPAPVRDSSGEAPPAAEQPATAATAPPAATSSATTTPAAAQSSNATPRGNQRGGRGGRGRNNTIASAIELGTAQAHDHDMFQLGTEPFAAAKWEDRKSWFIYDSGATGHLVNSTDFLINTRKLSTPAKFSGVTGSGECNTEGDIPMLGRALVHPDSPINCISGPQIEERYKVVFVQLKSYTVRISNELDCVFNFDRGAKLYIGDLAPIISPLRYAQLPAGTPEHTVLAPCVAEMKARYTKADVANADIARDMMEKLGAQDLMRMLRQGDITNAKIVAKDVERAQVIYGRSIPSIQGKSTRQPAGKAPALEASPSTRQDLVFYSDIFQADGVNLLLTVCKPIDLYMIYALRGMKEENIAEGFGQQVLLAKDYGFTPTAIHVDPARALVAMGRTVHEVPVTVVGPGTHVRIAERAIRLVKERMRCIITTLPYSLPRVFIPWCAAYVVNRLNCVPHKDGIAKSARETIRGFKLNAKVDLCLSFGQYVHVFNNRVRSSSVSQSRTTGCIALISAGNGHKTWKIYNLVTGALISSDNYQVLPTPSNAIEVMNGMYRADKGRSPAQQQPYDLEPDEPVTVPNPVAPAPVTTDVTTDEPEPPVDLPVATPEDPVEAAPEAEAVPVEDNIGAMHVSMNRGLRQWGTIAKESLTAEVKQLHDKGTFEPQNWNDMSPADKRSVIRCSLFFKEKLDTAGKFDKLKARLVAGGNEQDTSQLGDVSSPTVLVESLFVTLAIAAVEKRSVASVDIEGAYLECDMEGPPVYMVLPPPIASSLVEIRPSYAKFLKQDGSLVVRLKKALYGCVQSGKLWYKKLIKTLVAMGYEVNPIDPCILNRTVNGHQMTVACYVDDLLITHKHRAVVLRELDTIGAHFAGYKVQAGTSLGHLGMRLNFHAGGDITVDMQRYTLDAVAAWNPSRTFATPGDKSLFDASDGDRLSQSASVNFHSAAAKLLFLAKRTRPDILVEVSALCGRVTVSTMDDWRKMDRVFGYLKGTPHLGIRYSASESINPVVYSDASHNCHPDATSRTGIIVMMAGGPVATVSSKQKLVTKSSSEAELVGICDGATSALQVRAFLLHQGHVLGPTTLMEDNKSTIDMIKAGKPTSKRSRHINMRFYFVKQHVDSGEVYMVYCPTEDMLADMCTKAQVGYTFTSIRDRVIHPVGSTP